jgi:hypothetical protein
MTRAVFASIAAGFCLGASLAAQPSVALLPSQSELRLARQGGRGAQPPQAPETPRAAAPIDLVGTWVPVVTEDWRFRMVTPPVGDVASIPVNEAGRKAAQSWDPAKDVAAGEQCKAYGAAGLMRMPTRVRFSWQDDTTLRMESDNGQQTRLFRFGDAPAPSAEPSWQGHSVARWETMTEGQGQLPPLGGQGGAGPAGPARALSGGLKVVTTRMRPGYLRRNGVPYSGQAVMTEFLDVLREPNGDTWMIVTAVIEDPTYLAQPLMLSTHFKKEPDGSKWNPRPCEVTMPVVGRQSGAR